MPGMIAWILSLKATLETLGQPLPNTPSAILETNDGKDIMVPNEQVIHSNFINWTRKNKKQRCLLNFTVACDTDLDLSADLLHMIRRELKKHGIQIPHPQRQVRILNPGTAA